MATAGIGQSMIERYAKTRRERLFRANGQESVILQDSARGHFPVYLSAREEQRAHVVALRAHWSARSVQSDRVRLHECVNRFNDRNRLLTASVRESHFSSALAVVGTSRFWVRDEDDFRPFVRFLDISLTLAVKLFEFVNEQMSLPSTAELEQSLQLTG